MRPSLKDIRKKRQSIIFHEGSETNISLEEINNFEEKHNIEIPEQYKDFLLKYNGVGVIEGYLIPPNNEDDLVCIDDFMNLEWSEVGNSDEQVTDEGVLPPKGLMNIAMIFGGHSEIFIGVYKGESYGKIYYCEDREPDYIYLLANSFNEFLNNVLPRFENEFHELCANNEFDKAKELVKSGYRCDYMIYFALENKFGSDNDNELYELIKMLVDNGENFSGMLVYAAFVDKPEIVKFLHKKGGDINEVDYESNSVLYEAIIRGKSIDLVQYLLENNVNINKWQNISSFMDYAKYDLKYFGKLNYAIELENLIKKYYDLD